MQRRKTGLGIMLALTLGLVTACETVSHVVVGEPLPGSKRAFLLEAADGIDSDTDWQGTDAADTTSTTLTARSENEWQALWQRVGKEPPGPMPKGAVALAAFLGKRPSTGYAVSLESWELEKQPDGRVALVVTWREKIPPSGAVVEPKPTTPYTVQLIKAMRSPIVFRQLAIP